MKLPCSIRSGGPISRSQEPSLAQARRTAVFIPGELHSRLHKDAYAAFLGLTPAAFEFLDPMPYGSHSRLTSRGARCDRAPDRIAVRRVKLQASYLPTSR